MAAPIISHDALEEITCKVCYTTLSDPRLLSCHHSFCLSCLSECMEDNPGDIKISCPKCKCYTVLPKGGIKFLPSDNKAKRLIEKYAKMERTAANGNKTQEFLPDLTKKLIPECGNCSSGAKFLCIDCELAFCQSCKEKHESENLKNYDDHYMLALRKELHCNLHTGSLVTGICSDCRKSLCPLCASKHSRGHEVLRLKAHNNYREKLRSEIDALTGRIHLFELAVAETQKMLAYYTDVIGSARSTFSDISTKVMATIMSLEEECLVHVQRACKKHAEHLNLEFLDDATSSKMQHLTSDIRQALASPPDQLLSSFKELSFESHELRSIQVPDANFGKVMDTLKHDDLIQNTLDYFLDELNKLFSGVRSKIDKLSLQSRQRLDDLDLWYLENAEFTPLDIDGMCSDSESETISASGPSPDQIEPSTDVLMQEDSMQDLISSGGESNS